MRRTRPSSELPDEPDLGPQLVAEPLLDRALRQLDEVQHVAGGGAAEVHDDVGVAVEDLGGAARVDVALEPALIDETSGADAFQLLKDRTGAGVEPEIRVLLVAPLQVLAHHAAELFLRRGREAEGDREDEIAPVVQDA